MFHDEDSKHLSKQDVVIGAHYDIKGESLGAFLKVYNISDEGVVGGILFQMLTGEHRFTKGFRPGPGWGPPDDEGYDRDALDIVVRIEDIGRRIPAEDLKKLEELRHCMLREFFSSNTAVPFCEWQGEGDEK